MLDERPPTLGSAQLVCIDGPGGSGKTTLAAALASVIGAPVVHMDDLYDGWSGLGDVAAQLGTVLRPLAAGQTGHYRRYDWDARAYAETVEVQPTTLLVVEGVGSGSLPCADLHTVLVWVEAPRDLRLRRGIDRDGEHLRAQWLTWQAAEDQHFMRDRTRERADLVTDGRQRMQGKPH